MAVAPEQGRSGGTQDFQPLQPKSTAQQAYWGASLNRRNRSAPHHPWVPCCFLHAPQVLLTNADKYSKGLLSEILVSGAPVPSVMLSGWLTH